MSAFKFLAGIIFLLIAAALYFWGNDVFGSWKLTQGTIVDVQISENSGTKNRCGLGADRYYATISFDTSSGENITFINGPSCTWEQPAGSAIDVYYDPKNPRNATLHPGLGQWLYSGIALIIALWLMWEGRRFLKKQLN